MTKTYPFSTGFETSLLKILLSLSEKAWTIRALKYLDPEKMPSKPGGLVLAEIQKHFETYSVLPTVVDLQQAIQVLLTQGKIDDKRYEEASLFLSTITLAGNINLDYANDLLIRELQRQAFIEAIQKAGKALGTENSADLFQPFEQARMIGQDLRLKLDSLFLPTDIEKCINTNDTNIKGRPVPLITSELTDGVGSGGVYPGRLAAFLGATGRGKTTALVDQACLAARLGLNTIFFTLEMYEIEIAEKIISNITEIPINELSRNAWEVATKFKNIMKSSKGKIIIKHLPSSKTTPEDIRFYIQNFILEYPDFKPSLIVIDYADLLKPTGSRQENSGSQRTSNAYYEQGDTFEELKTLASELHLVIWTAIQARRAPGGTEDKREILTEADAAESMKKIHILDLLISICMMDSERASRQVRLYISKNRFGPSGQSPFGPYSTGFHINKFVDEVNPLGYNMPSYDTAAQADL